VATGGLVRGGDDAAANDGDNDGRAAATCTDRQPGVDVINTS